MAANPFSPDYSNGPGASTGTMATTDFFSSPPVPPSNARDPFAAVAAPPTATSIWDLPADATATHASSKPNLWQTTTTTQPAPKKKDLSGAFVFPDYNNPNNNQSSNRQSMNGMTNGMGTTNGMSSSMGMTNSHSNNLSTMNTGLSSTTNNQFVPSNNQFAAPNSAMMGGFGLSPAMSPPQSSSSLGFENSVPMGGSTSTMMGGSTATSSAGLTGGSVMGSSTSMPMSNGSMGGTYSNTGLSSSTVPPPLPNIMQSPPPLPETTTTAFSAPNPDEDDAEFRQAEEAALEAKAMMERQALEQKKREEEGFLGINKLKPKIQPPNLSFFRPNQDEGTSRQPWFKQSSQAQSASPTRDSSLPPWQHTDAAADSRAATSDFGIPPAATHDTVARQRQQQTAPGEEGAGKGAAVMGASVVGGVAGLMLMGPIVGVVAAGGAAYTAAAGDGPVGTILRSTGSLAASAGGAAKRFDDKHQVMAKTAKGVATGVGWVVKTVNNAS